MGSWCGSLFVSSLLVEAAFAEGISDFDHTGGVVEIYVIESVLAYESPAFGAIKGCVVSFWGCHWLFYDHFFLLSYRRFLASNDFMIISIISI